MSLILKELIILKKRVLSLFMVLVLFAVPFTFMSDVEMQSKAITQNEIVQRANQLYNTTWTPLKTVKGYGNGHGTSYTFNAGKSYRMPYGMPVNTGTFIGYDISVNDFIAQTKNLNSKLYTSSSGYNNLSEKAKYCPYYAMDCSTFVSYCWNLSSRHTTNTLPNVSTKLGKCNSANVDKLQIGDAINSSGHVVLVTGVSNGNIEITEETPPQLIRTTYTKNQIVNKYSKWDILRYANPNPPILPGTIDNSYKQPVTVKADHKISTYNEYGTQESNHYIDSGDNCYIEAVYTNGFVRVQYPISSGTRWAYAKRDDFNIPRIDTKWYSGLTPVDIGDIWYGFIIYNKEWKNLTNNGENVSFKNGTKAYNQLWRFTKNNDGSYTITSLADRKVLDVAEGSSTNGANVGVYESHGGNNQKWFIYGSSGHHYLRAACTDCVLDLAGGKFTESVNAQMWEYGASDDAEQFHLWGLNDAPKLTVNVGNSATKTKFTWSYEGDCSKIVDHVDLKIWKGKLWEGDYYQAAWGEKGTSKEFVLPAGHYEAYIDRSTPLSSASDSVKMSNVVKFDVKAATFNVAFNANGGSVSPTSKTVTHNSTYGSLPAPTKTGYTFTGWYTSASGGSKVTDTTKVTITSNQTLYAQWSATDEVGKAMTEKDAAGQTIPDGDYWIYSGLDRNYYLDIPGNETASNNDNARMWTCENGMPGKYDVWNIKYLDNGFYKITQYGTNVCLDVKSGSNLNNTNVQMYVDNSHTSQQWSISKTETGYRIQSRCNGFYLDVEGAKVAKGTNVRVSKKNDSKCQNFCFIPYNPDERPIEDGVYGIQSAKNSEYYVDAKGNTSDFKNGTNICIGDKMYDTFRVEYAGDGYYKIFEATTGLALEVSNPAENHFSENQRNIQLYESNNSRGQLWKIRKTGDGHYFIISKLSGYYFDLLNGECVKGQNISQVYYVGGNAQKWNFVSTVIKGDANNDKTVDISDAVMLQKWLLGSGSLTNWKNVDLCEDGRIDVFDMIEMRKLIVKK